MAATFWDLTLFEATGLPILGSVDGLGAVTEATFSTDPAHPRPFLQRPTDIGSAEADFQKGKVSTAQVNYTVLDKRLVAGDPATGIYTSILFDAFTGESRLNGCRAVLQQRTGSTRIPVIDGFVGGAKLHDSKAGFTGYIRDTSERVRKIRAFQYSNTTSVFPRGVTNGYGRLSNGGWMIPPTQHKTGTFERMDLRGSQGGRIRFRTRDQVLTDPMKEAGAPEWHPGMRRRVLRRVKIRWRPHSGGDWVWLVNMQLPDLLLFTPTNLFEADGELVKFIYLRAGSGGTIPANGQLVDIVVEYAGPTSSSFPVHFEGTHGEFIKKYYDGDFSTDADGNPVDPGVRYNEAAVLALTEPCRFRITESVEDDGRKFLEPVWQALGAVPVLNEAGEISPIRYHLPAADVDLPVITTAAEAGFDHDTKDAVNVVRFTFQRDYYATDATQGAGDGVRTEDVPYATATNEAPMAGSIARLGEQAWEVKAISLRALGGDDGQPLTGDTIDTVGANLAAERAHQALDRLILGGKRLPELTVFRSDYPTLVAGGWAIVQLPWIPGATTRGSNLLVQVTKSTRKDPVTLVLDTLSAGPASSPLLPPALSVPAVGDDGVVSVVVTALPAGARSAAVEYAESGSEPDAGSALWRPAGRGAFLATVTTPAFRSGASVWIRARSVAEGRRPSLWTDPVLAEIGTLARVLTGALSVADDTGVANVAWTATPAAAGIRVWYAAASPNDTPDLVDHADFEAGDQIATLPLVVQPGLQLTVDIEPWTGWTGSAVSGTAGARVRRRAIRAEDDFSQRIYKVEQIAALETETHYHFGLTCGALVKEVWWALGSSERDPTDEDWDVVAAEAETQAEGGTVFVPGVTASIAVPKPAAPDIGLLYLVPKVLGEGNPAPLVTPAVANAAWYVKVYAPAAVGPSLDVTAVHDESTCTITWAGDGVQLSIDGGAYAPPPASPIIVTRPAAGALPLVYSFRGVRDGITVTDSVPVLPEDKDTVTPDLEVTPLTAGTDNSQASFTAIATRPDTGAAVPVVVTLVGCSGTNNGVALPAGTPQTVAGTIVALRPAFGSPAGSARFVAAVAGGGSEEIQRTITAVQSDTAWPVVETEALEGATTATLWWRVVERGIAVDLVEVQTQTGASGWSAPAAPMRGIGDASAVKGGTLGVGEYEQDITLDPTRFSWIFPRLSLATGDVMTLGPFGFDRDKRPNLLQVKVNGQTIEVLADAGDTLSLAAHRTDVDDSDPDYWASSVDGISTVFEVPVPSGESWPVNVVAYAAGVVDVTGGTPKDEMDVVVAGTSAPSEPGWVGASGGTLPGALAAPAVGDDVVTLTLRASSAPAGYTKRVSVRLNGGSYTDITSDLTPSGGTLPTTPTDYTWASTWLRGTPPGPSLTIDMRCEILSGSSTPVATAVATCTYTIG